MAEFTEKLQESMLPHIRGLGIYQGVQPVEAMAERAGIPPDRIIRLNGNENPYGASPVVAEALAGFPNFNHYPDPEQRQLREALSGYVGIEPERIIAGNGSDELIDMLFRMFVGPGDNIINSDSHVRDVLDRRGNLRRRGYLGAPRRELRDRPRRASSWPSPHAPRPSLCARPTTPPAICPARRMSGRCSTPAFWS